MDFFSFIIKLIIIDLKLLLYFLGINFTVLSFITMGEKGAFAYRTSDSRKVYQPAVPVKVASTVGAGDSFSAAFAKAYLDGASLGDALKSGAELSSFVCSRTEAVPRK